MLYSLSEKMPTEGARPQSADRHQVETLASAIHHYGHIKQAEIVLALVDRHADLAGAEAAIYGHIETSLLPETQLLGDEREAEGAEWQPRQSHFDGCARTGDAGC
jgi:hypothetical protein